MNHLPFQRLPVGTAAAAQAYHTPRTQFTHSHRDALSPSSFHRFVWSCLFPAPSHSFLLLGCMAKLASTSSPRHRPGSQPEAGIWFQLQALTSSLAWKHFTDFRPGEQHISDMFSLVMSNRSLTELGFRCTVNIHS